jgi:hypothetical protein
MNNVIKQFLSQKDNRNFKSLSALIIAAFNAGQPWG